MEPANRCRVWESGCQKETQGCTLTLGLGSRKAALHMEQARIWEPPCPIIARVKLKRNSNLANWLALSHRSLLSQYKRLAVKTKARRWVSQCAGLLITCWQCHCTCYTCLQQQSPPRCTPTAPLRRVTGTPDSEAETRV